VHPILHFLFINIIFFNHTYDCYSKLNNSQKGNLGEKTFDLTLQNLPRIELELTKKNEGET
jgi:hypothetical protein